MSVSNEEMACELLKEVVREHRDPDCYNYNDCDDVPCQWCVEAQVVIEHLIPAPQPGAQPKPAVA